MITYLDEDRGTAAAAKTTNDIVPEGAVSQRGGGRRRRCQLARWTEETKNKDKYLNRPALDMEEEEELRMPRTFRTRTGHCGSI